MPSRGAIDKKKRLEDFLDDHICREEEL